MVIKGPRLSRFNVITRITTIIHVSPLPFPRLPYCLSGNIRCELKNNNLWKSGFYTSYSVTQNCALYSIFLKRVIIREKYTYVHILKLLLSTVFAVYCILVIIALLITHAELRPCTAVAQRVGVSRTEALACRKLLSGTT